MIKIDLNDLLAGDRRQYYRIAPSVEEPIVLKIAGQVFPLLEVSGGGCRLPISALNQFSDADVLELSLPGRSASIMVRMRTMSLGEKTFGAEFIDLEDTLREEICSYVRAREIEIARRFRVQGGSTC